MPYPKTSAGYPGEMKAQVEAVAADNLGRTYACASEREARTIRARFYQYLAASKRDASSPPVWWTDAERREHNEFLRRFLSVEFAVDGPNFIIRPRDESPSIAALRRGQVLPPREGAPATSNAPTDADKSLAHLLEKFNARDK
jgi:hypothetical protein